MGLDSIHGKKSSKYKQIITIISFVILIALFFMSYNNNVDEETIKSIEVLQDETYYRMQIILIILGSISFIAFIIGIFRSVKNNN